jgi:Tfp pilus assembly protein PilW
MKKFNFQKGLSITEALIAIIVSTIVMGATYHL